jgi:hypothetical protein
LKIIIPRHKKLSNEFRVWLESAHGISALREQQWIDVRFNLHDRAVIAELKICDDAGTKKSIREALGQLLEYNHYPLRTPAASWLILIDQDPSPEDKRFIDTLRADRGLPLSIGWRTKIPSRFIRGGLEPFVPAPGHEC